MVTLQFYFRILASLILLFIFRSETFSQVLEGLTGSGLCAYRYLTGKSSWPNQSTTGIY